MLQATSENVILVLCLRNVNKVVSSVGIAADPTPNYSTVSHHLGL